MIYKSGKGSGYIAYLKYFNMKILKRVVRLHEVIYLLSTVISTLILIDDVRAFFQIWKAQSHISITVTNKW